MVSRGSFLVVNLAIIAVVHVAMAEENIQRFADSEHIKKLALELPARNGMRIVVEERFGRPDAHQFWEGLPIDFGKRTIADGKPFGWKLRRGRDLYMQHCVSCHDASGGGHGEKSTDLYPAPRDFRQGNFKWRSTSPQPNIGYGKPLRHDLGETIRLGIPGTAMPSFAKLKITQRDVLVEYVRWLAIRGEFEQLLAYRLEEAFDADEVEAEIESGFEEELEMINERWLPTELESSMLRPKDRPESTKESIALGQELFVGRKGSCAKCHGADGKGLEFPARDRFGNDGKVWDLTAEVYHGGAAPNDLFRRLRVGIAGSTMPVYPERYLSNQETWHLVNYVLSIAPAQLRDKQVIRRPPPKGRDEVESPIVRGEKLDDRLPVTWQGWGTLRGRFVFRGDPPKTRLLKVVKSREVCGDEVLNESFLVGKDGGLSNVLVYLHTPDTPWKKVFEARTTPTAFDIKECRFLPHVLPVLIGSEFLVRNLDPIAHNVNYSPKRGDGFNFTLPVKGKFTHAFRRSEERPVQVSNAIYPHMASYIIPRENPYFAVTDASGRFQIEKLPAGGKLEFEAWHERAQTGWSVSNLRRGKLSVELMPDEVVDLDEIVVTPEMVK